MQDQVRIYHPLVQKLFREGESSFLQCLGRVKGFADEPERPPYAFNNTCYLFQARSDATSHIHNLSMDKPVVYLGYKSYTYLRGRSAIELDVSRTGLEWLGSLFLSHTNSPW